VRHQQERGGQQQPADDEFHGGARKEGALRRIVRHPRTVRHVRADRKSGGSGTMQTACPRGVACGSTRVRERVGGAVRAPAVARCGFRGNAPQNEKYRQGYTQTRVNGSSAGPNDASARQKHAFPS
jgi:hypothetical protein